MWRNRPRKSRGTAAAIFFAPRSVRRELTGELQPLGLGFEPRAENSGIEWIGETVADECRVLVLHVHVELADVVHQEIHDRAVVRELPARKHHLIRALLIE